MSCGGGTRTLTRTINQTALHGGDECPDKDVTSIEESCNVEECPGDMNVHHYQCSHFDSGSFVMTSIKFTLQLIVNGANGHLEIALCLVEMV